jgi:hypothetical protein
MALSFDVFFRGWSLAVPAILDAGSSRQNREPEKTWPSQPLPPEQTPGEPRPSVVSMGQKECKRMPDQDLSDDLLKTVHFEIKFKMRPYECTFGSRSETIHENMTSTGYAGWKIAEFVNTLAEQPIPRNFQRYLDRYGNALRPQDYKHLEVWFDVVDRSTRDDLRYEERMASYLGTIARGVGNVTGVPMPDED